MKHAAVPSHVLQALRRPSACVGCRPHGVIQDFYHSQLMLHLAPAKKNVDDQQVSDIGMSMCETIAPRSCPDH